MAAWMFIFPPSDPERELTLEEISESMREAGVTTGLDSMIVLKIFQKRPYFQLMPVAFGRPAEKGIDGSIIENFPRELSAEVKIDENDMADYKELNYVQHIDTGAVICNIIPPKPGVAGMRVDGKVVEPPVAKAARIPAGRNTTLSDDGLKLLATMEGHLEYSASSAVFNVRSVLDINGDVDYSTGNIDYTSNI